MMGGCGRSGCGRGAASPATPRSAIGAVPMHPCCPFPLLLPFPLLPAPSVPFLQPFPAMLAGVATGRAATHTLRIPAGMQCQNLKPGAAPFPFDGQWGRYHSPFMEGIRMQTWSNPGKSPPGAAGEAAASGRSAGLFPERTRV